MGRYTVGGLAAVLVAGALIAAAPRASAGCQDWRFHVQLCDGPIQPDGTWQRCSVTQPLVGNFTDSSCYPLGNNNYLPPFQPPNHIDP